MNEDSLLNITKAVASSGAIEVIHQAPISDGTTEFIKLISQLLICAATIFSILRKPKK